MPDMLLYVMALLACIALEWMKKWWLDRPLSPAIEILGVVLAVSGVLDLATGEHRKLKTIIGCPNCHHQLPEVEDTEAVVFECWECGWSN